MVLKIKKFATNFVILVLGTYDLGVIKYSRPLLKLV